MYIRRDVLDPGGLHSALPILLSSPLAFCSRNCFKPSHPFCCYTTCTVHLRLDSMAQDRKTLLPDNMLYSTTSKKIIIKIKWPPILNAADNVKISIDALAVFFFFFAPR